MTCNVKLPSLFKAHDSLGALNKNGRSNFFFNLIAIFGFSDSLLFHGLSLVVVLRILIVIASLVSNHRLWSTGSGVVVNGLSCLAARGIFLDQGLNPCSQHCQVES